MEMRDYLKELKGTFFGEVVFIREDTEHYYFELTYIDGKQQDEMKVRKDDGSLYWRIKGNNEWMYDFRIVA